MSGQFLPRVSPGLSLAWEPGGHVRGQGVAAGSGGSVSAKGAVMHAAAFSDCNELCSCPVSAGHTAVPRKHPEFRLLSQRLRGGRASAGWVTAHCPGASPGVAWQGAAGSARGRHCLPRSTRCPCHSFPERTVQLPLNSWQNRGPSCLLPATVLDAGGASSVTPHVFPLGAKRGGPTRTELEGLSQQCSALLATGEVWGGH